MRSILLALGVEGGKAESAIIHALEYASHHERDVRRIEHHKAHIAQFDVCKSRLADNLTELSRTLEKLSPASRRRLDELITCNWPASFDTEVFANLTRDIFDVLPNLEPARWADVARKILEASLVDDWKTLPPEIRLAVGQKLSSQRVPATVGLFARLEKLLKKAHVVRRKGPRPSNKRRFVTRMGRLWEGIGLKVTRVYDGMFEELLDSRFQDFGNAALSAVGADFPNHFG